MRTLPIKLIFLTIIIMLSIVGCSSSKELDDIQNGVIIYHNGSKDSIKVEKALKQLSKTYEFDYVSIDVSSDNDIIEEYQKTNSDLIEDYKKVKEIEKKLNVLNPAVEGDSAAVKNRIQLDYRKSLTIIKNPTLTAEQQNNLDVMVTRMAKSQILTKEEIMTLLNLQRAARLQIPKYSEQDGDADPANLPIIKVIYENNTKKTISLGKNPIPEQTLNNTDQLKAILQQDAWIANFSSSSHYEDVEEMFVNKDTFILLNYGNSCPHCHKLFPVLDEISGELNIPYAKIDTFIENNNRLFTKMIAANNYGLPEMKWVPTLLFIENGQYVSRLDAYEYAIENVDAPLGYDIDEEIISRFLLQAQ